MAVIPKNKRPEPTLESVEDYLYEYGQVGDDDKITIEGIEFEIEKSVKTKPKRIELHFEHPGAKRFIDKFKQTIWKEIKGNFDPVWNDTYKGYSALRFGYRSVGSETILGFSVEFTGEVVKGSVPAPIQEEGTTYILNATLKDNAIFSSDNTKKQIFIDGKPIKTETKHKIYKKLQKLFGAKYEKRIDDWLWTYYQQNRAFLDEYGKPGWDSFLYGDKAFVKYFQDHMNEMERESGVKAGDYTTWNPSDIWAVKNMSKVKQDLDKQLKKGSLGEMNNILVNLMESKELVGISLKMIKSKQNAEVKLHNVETSPILKDLKSFAKIEEYTMKDIKFRYDHIWQGDASYTPTQVKIGSGGKYELNIKRSGNRISINTQIKGAAAQGGQTPIDMVVDDLKSIKLPDGKSFTKDQNSYPTTVEEMDKRGYEKMYKFITKGQNVTAPTYDKFKEHWQKIYKKKSRTAIVKLMLLAFWYVTLKEYSSNTAKSAEFWTDLLYTGMKIKPGREFAPHAKIS